MNKNNGRKVVLFFVAVAFAGLSRANGHRQVPSDAIDDAAAFLKEAEARGMNIGELLADE